MAALLIDQVTLVVPLGYPDSKQQMFVCLGLRVLRGAKPGSQAWSPRPVGGCRAFRGKEVTH